MSTPDDHGAGPSSDVTQSSSAREPIARPPVAPPTYHFPRDTTGLLPWSFAQERLERTHIYWLATTYPDRRPHVTPLWGVWVDGAFYFDGMPTTRWARNVASNPAAALHLEEGEAVVIVDGLVDDLETDATLGEQIVQAWDAKYGRLHPDPVGSGVFRLRPRRARGWSVAALTDGTRWQFGEG